MSFLRGTVESSPTADGVLIQRVTITKVFSCSQRNIECNCCTHNPHNIDVTSPRLVIAKLREVECIVESMRSMRIYAEFVANNRQCNCGSQ
jgi:hypothetical protein